jgi:hypothetical protein
MVTRYFQPWCWTEPNRSKRRFDVATRVCFCASDNLWGTHLQCFSLYVILFTKRYRTVDIGISVLLAIWRSDAKGCSSSACRIALSIVSVAPRSGSSGQVRSICKTLLPQVTSDNWISDRAFSENAGDFGMDCDRWKMFPVNIQHEWFKIHSNPYHTDTDRADCTLKNLIDSKTQKLSTAESYTHREEAASRIRGKCLDLLTFHGHWDAKEWLEHSLWWE